MDNWMWIEIQGVKFHLGEFMGEAAYSMVMEMKTEIDRLRAKVKALESIRTVEQIPDLAIKRYLIIESYPDANKIEMIKALRATFALGPKEAKDLIETPRVVLDIRNMQVSAIKNFITDITSLEATYSLQ